jgi:hypothetical protein
MVARLKNAFDKASQLPDALQEQLAEQLIEEIDGETKWDATLQRSQDVLDQMAAEALKAHRAGKTHEGGFGQS